MYLVSLVIIRVLASLVIIRIFATLLLCTRAIASVAIWSICTTSVYSNDTYNIRILSKATFMQIFSSIIGLL